MTYKNSRKSKLLSDVYDILSNKLVVVVNIFSLKAEDILLIRRKFWDFDANINVAKNSIVRLALKERNLDSMLPDISNAIAFVTCNSDIPKFLKLLISICKQYGSQYLSVVSAKIDDDYFGIDLIKELASMDDLNHIYLKLIGALQSIPFSLIGVLEAHSKILVNHLHYYSSGNEAIESKLK